MSTTAAGAATSSPGRIVSLAAFGGLLQRSQGDPGLRESQDEHRKAAGQNI